MGLPPGGRGTRPLAGDLEHPARVRDQRAGGSAGIDMALHLLARLAGDDRAREVRRGTQHDPSRRSDRPQRRGQLLGTP